MSTGSCLHEGCVSIIILVFHICSSIKQNPHDIFIATTAGIGQGGVAHAGGERRKERGERGRWALNEA